MCVISVRITVQKPSGNTDIPKGGGLTGPQLLEGVAGKEGLQFSHKNKLKSEIFNDKKSL